MSAHAREGLFPDRSPKRGSHGAEKSGEDEEEEEESGSSAATSPGNKKGSGRQMQQHNLLLAYLRPQPKIAASPAYDSLKQKYAQVSQNALFFADSVPAEPTVFSKMN